MTERIQTCDLCQLPPSLSIRVSGAPVPETLCSLHAQRRRLVLDQQLTHYQVTSIGERVVSAEESARKSSSHVLQLADERKKLRSQLDQSEQASALLQEQIIRRNEMIDSLTSALKRSEAQRRKLADLLLAVGHEQQLEQARTLGLLDPSSDPLLIDDEPNGQRVEGERDTDKPPAGLGG